MRYFLSIFVFISVCLLQLSGQETDPKATIGGLSEGSISKIELAKVEKIIPSQNDIVIISFTMSYNVGEDDIVELVSTSSSLTTEMKDNIKQLKAGTEISFENIKAKRGLTVLILESVTLKLKD
jgi:hypothetical protein